MNFEVYNYTYVFDFEKRWNETAFKEYCKRRIMDPVYYSIIYLTVIFCLKRYMKNRTEFDLRQPLALWSTILAVFSITGALRSLPELIVAVKEKSFQFSVCIPAYSGPVPGFWGSVFTLSKVYELGDTLFIVLRKKPLVFLHWYHHITVMLFTWHSYSEHAAAARWFYTMNFVVHSFMYSYYALKAMQIYVPKQISLLITTMQLLQMVMGCYINIMVFMYKSRGEFCQQSKTNLISSSIIYITYFILFLNFFYKSYLVPKSKTLKQT